MKKIVLFLSVFLSAHFFTNATDDIEWNADGSFHLCLHGRQRIYGEVA